ncbi:unnamed protein product [Ostreobium quekettii]|uniref:RRM domain-containing protein n=1 Tax=Ostreobium quekettii TaxID=121088 RepID=A0A8S1IV43_9CHLO|nr:unnamed protein product [Ostreobium quekettii]
MSGYAYEASAAPAVPTNPYEVPYGYDPASGYGPPGACDASAYASQGDEIRTIFLTGFPDDVKERELNNMLRFLPGYQASQMNWKNGQVSHRGGWGLVGRCFGAWLRVRAGLR